MASSERALATPSWRATCRRAVAARAMWYALDAPCAWSLGAEDARAARWDEDEATTSRMVDEDDLDDDGALLRLREARATTLTHVRGSFDAHLVDVRDWLARFGAPRTRWRGRASATRRTGASCFRARWRRSARTARRFERCVGARASG